VDKDTAKTSSSIDEEKSNQMLRSTNDNAMVIRSGFTPWPTQSNNSTIGQNPDVCPHTVQNFLLVWLDSNIDQSNDDLCSSINQLRRIVNTVDSFTDTDECIDFLTQIKDEKVFIIISGSLSQHIVPCIHSISQLDSIYVLYQEKYEQLAKHWPKVKGIFSDVGQICDSLGQVARQWD
jgi:hypothetical protein